MSGARSRKIWTVEEDALLRSLVGRYGDARGAQSKWKLVADKIPGRTTKDCRKRWFHSLDPNVRKGRWTAEEDQILKQAYQELGPAWHIIASMIRGRKDDQCAKRYNEILDPSASNRLRQWSAQEDAILCGGVHELGNQWSILAQRLPGRPPLTCRNRWRALSRYSGCPATSASSPRRPSGTPQSEATSRETQSEMTTPQSNTMPLNDDMHIAADPPGTVLSDPVMFSTARELEGLDAWWDSSFLLGASPWPDATGALDSPRRPLQPVTPEQQHDQARPPQLPQPTAQVRHSERLQSRKSEATPVSTDEHSNTDDVLLAQVVAESTTPPPSTTHLDPNQRTVVVELETGGAVAGAPTNAPTVSSSTDSSTDSSADGLSALSFAYAMHGADTARPAADQPLLQLSFAPTATEAPVGSQRDDSTTSPRQRPVLQADQIAEMERSSQQMSASTVAPNGAQHIFHHHHHHHHHHYHYHYYDDRQAMAGQ